MKTKRGSPVTKFYTNACPLFIGLACFLSAAVADKAPPRGLIPGVNAKLTISVAQYDPSKPSMGTVKCVVRNESHEPVQVRLGYEGHRTAVCNRLMALGDGHRWEMLLLPMPRWQNKPTLARFQPGEERTIFELSLDEILFQGMDDPQSDENRKWAWDWMARPRATASPVHRFFERGFCKTAKFWAIVTVNDQELASNKVVLNVTPRSEL